jgi:signal transduction histidine kinase
MGVLPSFIRISALTLYAAEILVLAVRYASCNARGELVRFAFLLVLLAMRLVFAPASPVGAFLSVLTVWTAGELLILITGRLKKARILWGAASLFFLAVTVLAFSLGAATLPLEAFRGYSLGLLGALPLVLLFRLCRESRSLVDAVFFASTALLLAAEGARIAGTLFVRPVPDLGAWLVTLISACAGYSIFQDGYLLSSGWRGWEARRSGHEKLMRAAYDRILRTENALVLQDRLVVSGLLVMGAAHDFKNTLAQIETTADFALHQTDSRQKDKALRLLREHAEAGGKSAVFFLERFSREGREEPGVLQMEDCIDGFIGMARAAYRADGITFRSDLQRGVRVIARRGEIEQVLLNLTGNAVESFRRNPATSERLIAISCRRLECAGLVEVSDTAGGVAPDVASRLFQVSPARDGGTGLGLYLSRSLLDRNGGTLTYVALDGGSCFRMTLPLAEDESLI